MARRTVDLLPDIFRTDTNRKFLAATLDQLTQEPNLRRTQGYVGRRVGPGINPADSYVTEISAARNNYQLEPGVAFFRPDTNTVTDAITYPGMIDALDLQGAETLNQDRLWESEYYSWDPFCDLDKFVNYSQYYWLPEGPDAVDVSGTDIPLTDVYDVTRVDTAEVKAYQFSGVAGNNPVITLVRGGNYEFVVDQPGNDFWIQAAPNRPGQPAGTMPGRSNISSRDVLGVSNNGSDSGTVIFNVPLKTAQDFYYTLVDAGNVDLVSDTIRFSDINNVYVSDFQAAYPKGIDGITNLEGRTIIFVNRTVDPGIGGWQITTQFDPLPRQNSLNGQSGSFDTVPFDQVTNIDDLDLRYSVWLIQYLDDGDGRKYMHLSSVRPVPVDSKVTAQFGSTWSSTVWYKNNNGYFEQQPLLTAIQDTLWYQDSTNPDLFGQIRLIEQDKVETIDIDDIIGAKDYTAPNGVKFTNGLKVVFRGSINPSTYQNQEYYVEGVGTGPGVSVRVGFIDGEAYFGPWHWYQGRRVTGSVHREDVFQQYIYDTVELSLANPGAGVPEEAPLPSVAEPGAANGNGIRLIPVSWLVTPETYIRTPYSATLSVPTHPDYLTISRGSRDLNAWTRSNRWFHIDVINATAEYNNQVAVLDNNLRAKRPIIEFRPSMAMYQFGTWGKEPVDIIDFRETDAFSNINGAISYGVDGYQFVAGTRVIFAADIDPAVRNRVFEVSFITPDTQPPLIRQPVINLTPVFDGEARVNQTVVSLNGVTLQGKSFYFDGVTWLPAQEKTSVNQAPLFDVKDANGVSYGDRAVYPSSTFAGTRLFGYAVGGTQIQDEVLGFALRYLNINNIGDILFTNYLYEDTFLYVRDNVSTEINISEGFVRQYFDRIRFSSQIGWQPAITENRSRQVFRFVFDGISLIFDVPPAPDSAVPVLQIFVDGAFVDPDEYTMTSTVTNTVVTFQDPPAVGTVIEAQLISNQASPSAYYQIPLNLENNPLNQDSAGFTLGTIRNHYNSIGQNLIDIQGPINGANNTRDLGNILRYGDNIVQHSSPLVLAGSFLRHRAYDIFSALRFNSQEYEKFKNIMLDLAGKGDFVNLTPTQVLDQVMTEIASAKTNMSPFYWSDMIPASETFTSTTYTYTPISTPTFDTQQVYDFTSSNYLGLLVYLNGRLLTKGYEYEVAVDAPNLTVTVPLTVGDVIVIREYATTYGSFVPNTPTKMGLYPAFRPQMFLDKTSTGSVMVIQGHDGSITRAFGDVRDQILLEFETRIFDNLKVATPVPLVESEVIPGRFRDTDYTLEEINQMLSTDFLSWVGWNKLDYTTQNYVATNEFTWNYSQSSDRISGELMPGAWRGIYLYFYDTERPNVTPWEMLGFSEEPDWWQNQYGPAPYTSGNLVLWDDLEQGLVRDPAGIYYLPRYARPGLTDVIPSDSEGNLLSPLNSVVGNYSLETMRRSWTFGDGGPVESSWRSSSSYPFSIMRLLALTKPAKFFSLFADRDRYQFEPDLGQWLWDRRYRLDAKNLAPLYGNGVSKASFMNWIIDYNRQTGSNSTSDLETVLANTGVRLCWRTAAFTDKKYLKIYTERSTPNSLNTSLLLPDESYQLLLYKNQAFERVTYSSVIVQKTDTGWAVLGYSTTRPYFEILVSQVAGPTRQITVGNQQVRVPTTYTDTVVRVPYGYVFTNETAVCDFLLSYGQLLTLQGLEFENQENGYVLNWNQMAQEFLYWSQQGWSEGSLINLNPSATRLTVTRPFAVAESIATPTPENLILNQNRLTLSQSNLVIDRLDNTFRVTSLTSDTINYIELRFTNYEHMIVLDDVSIFADLIYDPATGSRQGRVLVSGWLSGDWNGTVNAPGFVLNQDNIQEWVPSRKYAKGEIVLFKNEYWSASTIIQPSQQFDYTLWIKSDYDEIQKGLLPNAAAVSDELSNSYSVYSANLEQEIDLFAYGLIGFRPREYMQALNLDDVSQVGLYQSFLGSKGTKRSAELFTYADLGKETAEYDVYEYWSILRSQYGATANRNYVELLLNEARLRSDPALIQVITPGQSSQADQTVQFGNVWKSTYKLNSPDFLPTTTIPVTDVGLPTAGYVKLDDVDYTVFNFEDLGSLNDDLNDIGVGTTVWVAKVNSYDWNIYRCERVPGVVTTVSNNLNNRALVQFDAQHGLSVNDQIIIRFFNDAVNGVYQVRAVPSLTTVIVDFVFVGTQAAYTGEGVAFVLESARVAQPSDIVNLPYARSLVAGARVWVDNTGEDRWAVLEKTDPYSLTTSLEPSDESADQRFGAAVTQSNRNLAALVGAPGYDQGRGGVYTFVKESNNRYVQDQDIQSLRVAGVAGFGNAVEIGSENWAVAGAADSYSGKGYAVAIYRDNSANNYEQRQLLVNPENDFSGTGDFGRSVGISQDELWMYVGSPGDNKVFAYARQDLEEQVVTYITERGETQYSFAGLIVYDTAFDTQISVTLANAILAPGVDYSIINNVVILTNTPAPGLVLVIARRSSYQLDVQNYSGVTGSSIAGSGASFYVNVARGEYSPTLQDSGSGYSYLETVTIPGTLLGGSTPANDLVLRVLQTGPNYSTIVSAGSTTINISSTDGLVPGQTLHYLSGSGTFVPGTTILSVPSQTQFIIDTPTLTAGTLVFFVSPNAITAIEKVSGTGSTSTLTFDLSSYLYNVSDIFSFSVKVNEAFYRPFIDYTYDSGLGEITFVASPPLGAVIQVVNRTYWDYVDTITVSGVGAADRFGSSINVSGEGRTIMIGSPNSTVDTFTQAGRSYIFDRSVQRFAVISTDVRSYTTTVAPQGPVFVFLNGNRLSDADYFINGDYTVSGSTVTLLPQVQLTVGDEIEISTNQFSLLQNLTSQTPSKDAVFGTAVEQCTNSCSFFVGAPRQTTTAPQAGQVEYWQNQARVYGTITSTIANPNLAAEVGEAVRINDVFVTLTAPAAWSSGQTWLSGTFVISSGDIFLARIDVPIGITLDDAVYWKPTGWAESFARDIQAAITAGDLPNVDVVYGPDLEIAGDGATRVFDIGSIYSSASSYTTVVYINDVIQTSGYTYNNTTKQITFSAAPAAGSVIRVAAGRITVSIKNSATAPAADKIQVLPGSGTLFDSVGFDIYVYQQTITAPVAQDDAYFGSSIALSSTSLGVVIGAPNGSTIRPTTFDAGTTRFDAKSTVFSDPVTQSGAVYEYDFLPSTNSTVNNPGRFVFGQEIYDEGVSELEQFGASLNLTTGVLLVGAPSQDRGDSAAADFGRVGQFVNPTLSPAWQVVRSQQPVVDISLLNTVFMYDRVQGNARQYFDYFDPLQGTVLGAVRQNLDFIGAVDPAAYNVGDINNYGVKWAQERVGQIWWNTNNVRFIDPNQDDIVYASRRWGQTFPGSSIDIYQWVRSPVPPVEYTGPGEPLSDFSYTVTSEVNEQGFFITNYFFWVSGITTVDTAAGKTLSIETLARYIESPRSSGISYVVPINASTVAIYNGLQYISAEDTVLHVEYDLERTENAVHLEYQLVAENRPDSFLVDSLYQKLTDSLAGSDAQGRAVPDPFLTPSEKYGVAVRPRQSMFINRFLALENYLERANRVMAQFPLAETRRSPLLNSEEPEPTPGSGAWDKRLANYEELAFQDLAQVSLGYRYLVASDATNNGLWTIYQVVSGSLFGERELALIRVQNYDTKLYWSYVNWYQPGFNPLTRPVTEVANDSLLETLTVPVGSAVKVTANAQNKWEIYQRTATGWDRVALESGTIEISASIWDYSIGRFGFDVEVFDAQYFDKEPSIETRKIIQALNQEIFIDELAIERNRLLILMFNFILTEQIAPTWLVKTSLVDVDHTIRELVPFQVYRQDNQDFVLDYIREVKPYHVQIREFNLIYQGQDVYQGSVNDFDLPAFWNASENLFVSPVLDNTNTLSTTSSYPDTAAIWTEWPYSQWYQNYLLTIESVTIARAGSGYIVAPTVIVEDDDTAVLTATINSQGQVTGITVVNPGQPRTTTAMLVLDGGLPAARVWQPSIEAFAGQIYEAPGGLVYSVAESGMFESVPPTSTASGNIVYGTTILNYLGTRAQAVANMGNGLVRSITTTIKYDRYQYSSTIQEWQPGRDYANGEMVRYDDRVWAASADDSTAVESITFDPDEWTLVPASALSGVDRTMGFYTPTANEPGLDLALLISGVDYPGVQVFGLGFNFNPGFDSGSYVNPLFDPAASQDPLYVEGYRDVQLATLYAYDEDTGTYVVVPREPETFTPSQWCADRYIGGAGFDTLPFDNIDYGPEGLPTYDENLLDAIYESEFVDPYLGVGPAAIDVDGGAFVDTYSSHAPEELVPGAIFDTLDIRVLTTPGSDWELDGHGFTSQAINYVFTVSGSSYSFDGILDYTVVVRVFNRTQGTELAIGRQFTVDWGNLSVTVNSGAVTGDVLVIMAYSVGGGSQLYRRSFSGEDIGDTVIVPVPLVIDSVTTQFLVFVNGARYTDFTAQVNDTVSSRVVFDDEWTSSDWVTVIAFGTNTLNDWSTPQQQVMGYGGGPYTFTLFNSMQGTNAVNAIVEKNGVRARPPESSEEIADGSSLEYYLPYSGDYDQSAVTENDVYVYVDDQQQQLFVDWELVPWDGSSPRSIMFLQMPPAGSRIVISVWTAAQYVISGNFMQWRSSGGLVPIPGDTLSITTFNDTAQQGLLTQVFVGPTTEGITVDVGFDSASSPGTTGSYDYDPYDFGVGLSVQTNNFNIGRVITDTSRMTVTLNGEFLFPEVGFTVTGTTVTILGEIINAADVVAITTMTNSTVPGSIEFRIFQDMRGQQTTYRITESTSSILTQAMTTDSTVISVQDASKFPQPNLAEGFFGMVTIDGERITYRSRDLATNTLTGLRRGTAGTGVAAHAAGAAVYDIGVGNMLPAEYQDRIVAQNFLADGRTTIFEATEISVLGVDSTELDDSVQVYVGGILQVGGYVITDGDPVTIQFSQPPTNGYQVSIQVRRGLSWYQPGPGTASDGVPLQETDTVAARFIRGD
jgi:hypothetical protein